jgi:Lar family restriction alleviation protein
MANKRKPCPFCGSVALEGDHAYNEWNVECGDCGARGPLAVPDLDAATERWNARKETTDADR